jgi:hypothetical protein
MRPARPLGRRLLRAGLLAGLLALAGGAAASEIVLPTTMLLRWWRQHRLTVLSRDLWPGEPAAILLASTAPGGTPGV